MPTPIVVPEMGESIVEATVTRWLKKEGDPLAVGDVLLELETEKVNLEVGSEHAGVLTRILRQAGEDVRVGDVLGMIEETATQTAPAGKVQEKPQKLAPPPISPTSTPSTPSRAEAKPPPVPPVSLEGEARPVERVRMTRRRRTIARNLVDAQHAAAMLTTFNEADMSRLMELRRRHKESFKQQHGVGLGITSFFVKATADALKKFPPFNAEIQGEEIVYKQYYDIGVALDTPEGLVVPVLRGVDKLSIAAIEHAIQDFAAKAREATLSLEDLRGGNFTITNGGVFGSLLSTPILNFPQVGILGMHRIEERPIALDGQVLIHPMMYLALSYDHRLIDGRQAVGFLGQIKELIEDPGALLLDG